MTEETMALLLRIGAIQDGWVQFFTEKVSKAEGQRIKAQIMSQNEQIANTIALLSSLGFEDKAIEALEEILADYANGLKEFRELERRSKLEAAV